MPQAPCPRQRLGARPHGPLLSSITSTWALHSVGGSPQCKGLKEAPAAALGASVVPFPVAELWEGTLSPLPKGGRGGAALAFKVHQSGTASSPRTLPRSLVQLCTVLRARISLISSFAICGPHWGLLWMVLK